MLPAGKDTHGQVQMLSPSLTTTSTQHSHLPVGAAPTNLPVSTRGVSPCQRPGLHHARTGADLTTTLPDVLTKEPNSLGLGDRAAWDEMQHPITLFSSYSRAAVPQAGGWLHHCRIIRAAFNFSAKLRESFVLRQTR